MASCFSLWDIKTNRTPWLIGLSGLESASSELYLLLTLVFLLRLYSSGLYLLPMSVFFRSCSSELYLLITPVFLLWYCSLYCQVQQFDFTTICYSKDQNGFLQNLQELKFNHLEIGSTPIRHTIKYIFLNEFQNLKFSGKLRLTAINNHFLI